MDSNYLHFTLGPVQSFVAQARRTRDFWAGSFLLSWLSAVAMRSVQRLAGDDAILFPLPDPKFMGALQTGAHGPKQGNVPNRFMAKVPAGFGPEQAALVVGSVDTAWRALATRVWERDLDRLPDRWRAWAEEVWQRQVPGFWDMQWVLTEQRQDSAALDRRKGWRSHSPPPEPGVKCGMMDGWQELSGAPRPNADEQGRFWQAVVDMGTEGVASDLREGEQLCTLAFIKRRFVRWFEGLAVPVMADTDAAWVAHGWRLPKAQPSTYYLAAAPWLAEVIRAAEADRITGYYRAAMKVDPERGEWSNEVRCVADARARRYDLSPLQGKQFASLDAAVFFEAALENPRLFARREAVPGVVRALRGLRRSAGELPPPSPFYAVLLMDGDSLGANMSDTERQPVISAALQDFTSKAQGHVELHSGFLVYAGGDDVLALLPLEQALPCALALRNCYSECFREQLDRHRQSFVATLSGAIEFAHVKMPLGKVLADAHRLLDEVAKDRTGRDAIACRVWKPGGRTLEWAMPWELALTADREKVAVQALAEGFQGKPDGRGEPMANRFFYRIRERFDLLNPVDEATAPVLDDDARTTLMAMEYLSSGFADQTSRPTMDEAKQRIRRLLTQCTPVTRHFGPDGVTSYSPRERLDADAALLVRFLAQKGVETR